MFASYLINAWVAGTIIAVLAGLVGIFVVMRGSAFAAHALPNSAFAGAAGAYLTGASEVAGLAAFSVGGAVLISALSRRSKRDVATALAIVLMLGLGDFFLTRTNQYAPELMGLLLGNSLLIVSSDQVWQTALLGAATCALTLALWRPLLVSSVVPDIAETKGMALRFIDLLFLVVVALTTAAAVLIVGALLVFCLLIGPPAAASALANRPGRAVMLSVALSLLTVWASIALSAGAFNAPVGFYVGTISALMYALGRVAAAYSGFRLSS